MVESMMLTVSKEGTPNVSCHQFLPQMASTQHVVLFTAYPDRALLTQAEAIGVRACLSKNDLRRLPGLIGKLAAAGR